MEFLCVEAIFFSVPINTVFVITKKSLAKQLTYYFISTIDVTLAGF